MLRLYCLKWRPCHHRMHILSVVVLKPLHTIYWFEFLTIKLVLNTTWHIALGNSIDRIVQISCYGPIVTWSNIFLKTHTGGINSIMLWYLADLSLTHSHRFNLLILVLSFHVFGNLTFILLKKSIISDILIDNYIILYLWAIELILSQKIKWVDFVVWIEKGLRALSCLWQFFLLSFDSDWLIKAHFWTLHCCLVNSGICDTWQRLLNFHARH